MVPRNRDTFNSWGAHYVVSIPGILYINFFLGGGAGYMTPDFLLTLLEPQSRFGDRPVKFRVVCPQNGTAVLNGSRHEGDRKSIRANMTFQFFFLHFIWCSFFLVLLVLRSCVLAPGTLAFHSLCPWLFFKFLIVCSCFFLSRSLWPHYYSSTVLRGTIVNGTYGLHKNLPGIYLTIFANNSWSY